MFRIALIQNQFPKTILAILVSCFGFAAHAHQYIQCWDLTQDSPDRLVISLSEKRNTFYLVAEVNSETPVNSGVLEMQDKGFSADQSVKNYLAHTEAASINVEIPAVIIGKASRDFNLTVTGVLNAGEFDFKRRYSCYSAMYNE